MNLSPFSDTRRQSTGLCAVAGLWSALSLAVVALMVSGCSFLGSLQPADPMLSTLVNQHPLGAVAVHSIDVEVFGPAQMSSPPIASQRGADQQSRSGEPTRRERLDRRERLAGQERLARGERLAISRSAAVSVGAGAETTEAKTEIDSRLVDAPILMTAVDSLFFSANQVALVVPSAPLDAVVALLQANPAGLIVLEGHADTGEVAAGALSWRRAQSARAYLLERGVPGSRVRIRSQGANSPSSIITREVGAQNRRVTLLLKTDNS